ncbi:hypothetical protein [Sphaerotilus uruguayifluvii]|uniref:Card1 CARF domain-containing protein n=1 Tax=Sphaerotilus uruguayifluvii TaxID=2735897 RepID=A0ABX2G7Q8_9BURK|nr:hypothetical protein [Leptothrix sp. C29]NRT58060.1 hypothetical protein [Leptothrix sp. C29]
MPDLPTPPQDLRPLRLIVFASEQLVPTLQFVLHSAEQAGRRLRAVMVMHTPDAARSAGPARRLQGVLQRWARRRQAQGAGFSVILGQGEASPAGVREVLMQWFSQAPDDEWRVNVTGGTKPMSAAAVELTLSTDLPARRVLYQELGSGWSELVQADDGLLDMRALAPGDGLVPASGTLERLLPLEEMVATQFSDAHQITTERLPADLPVQTLVPLLLAQGWNWKTALAALPRPVACSGSGVGFEMFLGAGLQACGIAVSHSLKVMDRDQRGKVVREIDLVACHRDRLICIDIKLPGVDDHLKGTQLADVAELAHSLGGRGALAVAVRPGWPEDEGTQRLARALGVQLLTQAHAAQPFSTLLRWIDRSLTPSPGVLEAEALLQAHQQTGSDVLSDGSRVPVLKVNDSGMLHLPSMMEQLVQRRAQPWALAQIDPQRYLIGIPKKALALADQPDWPDRMNALHRLLKGCSAPGSLQFKETPGWVTAQLVMRQGLSRDELLQPLGEILPPG